MYVLYQLQDRATQLRSLQAQPAAATGWAWCSSPAPHDQPHSNHCVCFTTGPAPQDLPHTAATLLQIFLKWEYSFQGSTTQSSSRAAPPRKPELAAGTAQALSPNSSLLSPPHWRAKLTVNIWLFIQPDEMAVCLADSWRAAWFPVYFPSLQIMIVVAGAMITSQDVIVIQSLLWQRHSFNYPKGI